MERTRLPTSRAPVPVLARRLPPLRPARRQPLSQLGSAPRMERNVVCYLLHSTYRENPA